MGRIRGCGQIGSHSECVDRRTGGGELQNLVFVQVAGGHYFCALQTSVVQDFANLARELDKIAAVQPHAPHRLAQRGGGACAFQSVIGVDQIRRCVTKQILKPLERLGLRSKGLHPRMRGRPKHGNAIAESGLRVAGADAAADVGCTSGENARFRRMRAAGAKIHYRTAAGHLHDPRSFGGHQRLKADGGKQVCFGDLRFHQRRAHRQEGFVGEDGRAFAHGEDVAGEAELAQCVEETVRDALELAQSAEVIDLFVGELQIEEIVDGLRQTCRYDVVAIAR